MKTVDRRLMWAPIARCQRAFIHLFISYCTDPEGPAKFVRLRLGRGLKRRFNTDEELMEEDGSLRLAGSCEEALLPRGRPVQVGNNVWVVFFFLLFFYFILPRQRKINTRPKISFRGPARRP